MDVKKVLLSKVDKNLSEALAENIATLCKQYEHMLTDRFNRELDLGLHTVEITLEPSVRLRMTAKPKGFGEDWDLDVGTVNLGGQI